MGQHVPDRPSSTRNTAGGGGGGGGGGILAGGFARQEMSGNRNDVAFKASPEVLLRIFRFRRWHDAVTGTMQHDGRYTDWRPDSLGLRSRSSKAGSPAACPYL